MDIKAFLKQHPPAESKPRKPLKNPKKGNYT